MQNALWAARNYARTHFACELYNFDWRWSIDLLSATTKLNERERQVQVPIAGRSAEVVFACALIASHKENQDNKSGIDPLHPHVGATASIAFPGEDSRDVLLPVGAIEDKTLLNRTESKRLVEVVIAKNQSENTLPPDKRYEFRRAESLSKAYEFITRHSRTTRGLNRSVSRAFEAYAEKTPGANQVLIDDRVEWLRWMLRKGRVVLLIDALDQIATAVEGLGTWLASASVRNCPVVITGRWESYLSRTDAFVENHWRTLRVEPFDRPRQQKYLGSGLANEILLKDETEIINYRTSNDGFRRHQWKELVKTPLLLSLIKVGNGGKRLAEIHNRFELYDEAVNELIQKGWRKATEDQKQQLRSSEAIRVLLGQISWYIVCQHNFSGILEGEPYRLLQKNLGQQASLLESLKQIDVTTAFQVLDRADSRGLAFRHRSFLEFFAACHLMSTKPDLNQLDLDSGEAK